MTDNSPERNFPDLQGPTIAEFAPKEVDELNSFLDGFERGIACRDEQQAFEIRTRTRRRILYYSELFHRAKENGWLDKQYEAHMMEDYPTIYED